MSNMPLNGKFQIAFYIDRLKNIELFKQGIYQLRLSVYCEEDLQTFKAVPQELWSLGKKLRNSIKTDPGHIIPAHIIEAHKIYCSRSILIRYQEETVPIQELSIFHLTLPMNTTISEFRVSAELMFTNMEEKKPKTPKLRLLNSNPMMECINHVEYSIRNPYSPFVQYLPVTFDPKNFCLYECLVSTVFLGYAFQSQDDVEILFGEKYLVGAAEVNSLYYSLVDPLKLSHEMLNKTIENICEEIIELNCRVILNDKVEDTLIPFYDRIKTHNRRLVSEYIFEETLVLSREIISDFAEFVHLIRLDSRNLLKFFKKKYDTEVSKKFEEFIKIDVISQTEIKNYLDSSKRCIGKAKKIWETPYYNNLNLIQVEPTNLFEEIQEQPLFFTESYLVSPMLFLQTPLYRDSYPRGLDIHVIVLVHGYKGSSMDMHMIKAYISIVYPHAEILCSRSNESSTDCFIGLLGQNLAKEVIHFITDIRIPHHRLKLSFLGHSMGGLIIRSALPHLESFSYNMNSFISLSSPHLGVPFSDNLCFSFGKWVIKKFSGSLSFQEMTFNDEKELEDTFLYSMSKYEGLSWFENIVLFSCKDDPYVSEDSARIEMPFKAVNSGSEKGFLEMIENTMSQIDCHKLMRIDVHFKHKGFLKNCVCCGNRHIDFLDNPYFIKMMCYGIPGLFSEEFIWVMEVWKKEIRDGVVNNFRCVGQVV